MTLLEFVLNEKREKVATMVAKQKMEESEKQTGEAEEEED